MRVSSGFRHSLAANPKNVARLRTFGNFQIYRAFQRVNCYSVSQNSLQNFYGELHQQIIAWAAKNFMRQNFDSDIKTPWRARRAGRLAFSGKLQGIFILDALGDHNLDFFLPLRESPPAANRT